MKKALAICFVVVMLCSMTVSAFAAPGVFVSSPSLIPAPELISGENESEGCEAQLKVTAYSERDTLSSDARQELETAYTMIVGTTDLRTLNGHLSELADELGVEATDFAVSDLFDISATECTTGHDKHGGYKITLKPESLDKFVCVMHYYNGEWIIAQNTELNEEKGTVEFSVGGLSPFAIVTYTGDAEFVDDFDASPILWASAAGATVILAFLILLLLLIRRKKKSV